MRANLSLETLSQSAWYIRFAVIMGISFFMFLVFYFLCIQEDLDRFEHFKAQQLVLQADLAKLVADIAENARQAQMAQPANLDCVQSLPTVSQFKFVGTLQAGMRYLGLILLANGEVMRVNKGYCLGKAAARIMDISVDKMQIGVGKDEKTLLLSQQLIL